MHLSVGCNVMWTGLDRPIYNLHIFLTLMVPLLPDRHLNISPDNNPPGHSQEDLRLGETWGWWNKERN